jgi:hypothetical protein
MFGVPAIPRRVVYRIFASLAACCAFLGAARAAASAEIIARLDVPSAPAIINRFYEYPLLVTGVDGVGKTGLRLEIRGRMPEHAHGLPTVPQIVEEGGGRYRIKGLSFNMPGRWVVEILRDDELLLRQEFTVRF